MADISASDKAGDHEDMHGKFRVLWVAGAWWYVDDCEIVGELVDDANGPYNTSAEAYDAATGYGC